MITLLQVIFIVVLAILIRRTKKAGSIGNYILVLVAGFITFLSVPMLTQGDGIIDTGVQIFAEISGVYAIIWSIVKMVQRKKK